MEKDLENKNMFFNFNEFDIESKMAEEYLKADLQNKIYLYQIDIQKTKTHKLYGESETSDKNFKKSVELYCKLNISEKEVKNLDSSFGYDEKLTINFSVLENDLQRLNVNIKPGDYIKYYDGKFDMFFEVVKANNINTTSNFSKNYKSRMRKFEAVMIKDDIIDRLNLSDNEST